MQLRSLVITANCQISTSSLNKLGKAGVSVMCINQRDPSASIVCYNGKHGNAFRRMAQYQLYTDTSRSLTLARLLVKHKLHKHARFLVTLAESYPAQRSFFLKVSRELHALKQHAIKATDMAQLLGYEGAAGKRFFEAYKLVFNTSWAFTERNRRPPKDPVNAMLSLSYAMVHYEAVRACISLGLDTQIGILHRISYNRDSLACDLVELFRAKVNIWVWQLFKDASFSPGHFKIEKSACLLTQEGSRIFYPRFHQQIGTWRKELRHYAQYFARYLQDHYQEVDA
jgi:CRISPR-associated protein Cas1